MTVLIVGESNPYGQDPRFALYHWPRNASGNRLREHLGLTDVEYHKLLKVNLCRRQWDMREARWRAQELMRGPFDVLVLLGAKVRAAFDGPEPFTCTHDPRAGFPILVGLPHPSGLNRTWLEPDARVRAVGLLQEVAPGVPWRYRP